MKQRLRIEAPDGTALDVDGSTQVQIERVSPVWWGDRSTDAFQDVKAYNISLPATAHNVKLLAWPHKLNVRAEIVPDGWKVRYDGIIVLEGKASISSSQPGGRIELALRAGGAALGLTSLFLSELALGTVEAGNTSEEVLAHAASVQAMGLDADYAFPLVKLGQLAFGATPTYNYANIYRDGTYRRHLFANAFHRYGSLIPMPRFVPVLRAAVEAGGLTLGGFFDTSVWAAELRKILFFSNVTLDVAAAPNSDEGIGFEELDGMRIGGRIRIASHLPMGKTVADVVRAACNLFCLAADFSQRGRLELFHCAELIRAGLAADWTSKASPAYTVNRVLTEPPTRWLYTPPNEPYAKAQEFPAADETRVFSTAADTVAALTDEIEEGDTQSVYVESLTTYLTAGAYEIETIEGLETFLFFRIVGSPLRPAGSPGSEYKPTSTVLVDERQNFSINEEDREISYLVSQERLPRWDAGVVTPLTPQVQRVNEIILLLQHGLHNGGWVWGQVPYASASDRSYEEGLVSDISLLMDGERGVYETFWREWVEYVKGLRMVRYAVRLTAKDLAELDFQRRYRIENHSFFLRKVQITLTPERILPAMVEMMQV